MNVLQRMTRGANDPDLVWTFTHDGTKVPLAQYYELIVYPANSARVKRYSGGGGLDLDTDGSRVIWSMSLEEAEAIGEGEGVYQLFGTTYMGSGNTEPRRRLWSSGPFVVELDGETSAAGVEVPGVPGPQGPEGPPGARGAQGPAGDETTLGLFDPGDITLAFTNALL